MSLMTSAEYVDLHGDNPALDDAIAGAMMPCAACGQNALCDEDGLCSSCAREIERLEEGRI